MSAAEEGFAHVAAGRTGASWGQPSLAAPFVIELVGPPASGKTTLSQSLARALADRGIPLSLRFSLRPDELRQAGGAERKTGAVQRILARGAKALDVVAPMEADPTAETLMRIFPQPGHIGRLRMRRYLRLLATTGSADDASVILQDQGYLCAIATLARRTGRLRRGTIEAALQAVPLPHLVVLMGTPRQMILERLHQRRASQPRLERLFETAVSEIASSLGVFDQIGGWLEDRNHPLITVSSHDRASLSHGVSSILSTLDGHAFPSEHEIS